MYILNNSCIGFGCSGISLSTEDTMATTVVQGDQRVDIKEKFSELKSSRKGLSTAEANRRLGEYGPNALEEKKENLLLRILGYFWGPIPWMIEAAAILSLVVDHIADFVLITILLLFNGLVAFVQEYQAGNAIEALKKKLAINATALRDGTLQKVIVADLVPGDVIRLKLGDIVPADAILFDGDYLTIDQSALTGESLPTNKKKGEIAYSGTIVQKGEMLALVTGTGKNTFFGKTAQLVQSAESKSHFQKAVMKIGNFLIVLSISLVFALLIIQTLRGDPPLELMKFSLILIVASIPVAMPAVLSVTMAVGALALSRMKAIVTRLESIEEMAGVDILCSDKTGTLTYNRLTIGAPALFNNATESTLLLSAALASRKEEADPIDHAIIQSLKTPEEIEQYNQKAFIPFDPVIKRTEATITRDSSTFKVTKGAPQVILELCNPNEELHQQVTKAVDTFAQKGHRTLGVARSENGTSWTFLGLIPMFDQVRDDSASTIREAQEHGVEVKMVTGDNLAIAKQVAEQLNIGSKIYDATELGDDVSATGLESIVEACEKANGFAQVFPENKFAVVKALQTRDHIVGMTGDGVNDSPALKQADLGIAVSGATDAARAAASLVLTAPGLSVIIGAIEGARRIFERMNTYAIYRITETLRVMFFMVLAMIIYNTYPITALMLIMLALLNDIPIMTIAYDNTLLPPKPVKWRMGRVIFTSCVLGTIGIIETFLLWIYADSYLGIPTAQLQSIIFLKLSLAGHLTLLVVRARHAMWKPPYPALPLFAAIIITQAFASLLVGFGWLMAPIPWSYVAASWGYCLFWMVIEDRAKLVTYQFLGE